MAIEYFTQHIARNKEKINIEYLSKVLSVSSGLLIAAIENQVDEKGKRIKLPRRCIPELLKYFSELCP